MSGSPLPPLQGASIERVSQIIGDAFTGSVLARMLGTAGLHDPVELSTKWKRVYQALATAQNAARSGRPVIDFIKLAGSPAYTSASTEAHESLVRALNVPLLLEGYALQLDGRMLQVPKAGTVSAARQRADRLREELTRRRLHPDVIAFCREELVAKDYFHAVFEATKSLSDKLRRMTGLSDDGTRLAQVALERGGDGPYLLVNAFKDASDFDDHDGVAAMLRGAFKVCRNPQAHAPRIYRPIDEQDAWDLLTNLSYLHRRLDAGTPTARAKSTSA